MPSEPALRQPEPVPSAWFRRDPARRLMQESQREAVPELTRVFGHSGLYLRPSGDVPESLSGNMLASVLSLHREDAGFAGALRCRDDALPVASGSLSLVYAFFVLETSPSPEALVAEMARLLKPEGVLLLHTLNPWSASRLRWMFQGLQVQSLGAWQSALAGAGLEVVRRRHVGSLWFPAATGEGEGRRADSPLARFRAANVLVARRRDSALTPIRPRTAGLGFAPGISTG